MAAVPPPSALQPLRGVLRRGAQSPQPAQPPVGAGGKVGVRRVLTGRPAPGWMTAHLAPVTALSGRMEKASAPLCCIRHSELPTASACCGVRSTSHCGQQTQHRDPKAGRAVPQNAGCPKGQATGWQSSEASGGPGPCSPNPTVYRNHPQGWLHPTYPKGADPGGQGRGPRPHV